eukprot:350928-Chlamydomonas_euryale.AAC.3
MHAWQERSECKPALMLQASSVRDLFDILYCTLRIPTAPFSPVPLSRRFLSEVASTASMCTHLLPSMPSTDPPLLPRTIARRSSASRTRAAPAPPRLACSVSCPMATRPALRTLRSARTPCPACMEGPMTAGWQRQRRRWTCPRLPPSPRHAASALKTWRSRRDWGAVSALARFLTSEVCPGLIA